MKFTAIARNRHSERLIALVSAVAVLLSIMAIYAAPARAHNGTVSWDCDGWVIDLNAYAGGTVEIVVDGQVVDSSTFQATYDNSGTWDDSQNHTLQIVVNANDDGDQPVYNLGPNGTFSPDWPNGEYSFTLNITQTACTQPPQNVSVAVAAGTCQVGANNQASGSVEVTITPASGATVNVYSNPAMTNLVGTLTSTGSIDDLAPGTYYWSATPAQGFALTGPSSGQVTIDDCDASVTVVAGPCVVIQGQAAGTADVTIDPDSAATVNVYSDAAMTNLVASVSSSDTITGLAPGTYYWEADAAPGFDITGPDSGQFTVAPCDVTVAATGACVVQNGTAVGQISADISTPGAATIEVVDAGGTVVATFTSTGVADVPVGADYSWTATASSGFAISGPSSGTVQIDDCSPPPPPPPPDDDGEIIVEKVVLGQAGRNVEFDFDTTDFTLGDSSLAHGESSSSGPLPAGTGYAVSEQVPNGWTLVSAVCDDGSDPSDIDLSAGEVVTCTFTNQIEDSVLASIQVTVEGECEVDGDEGEGVVDVTMSVPDGARVVVRDSDGDVVGSASSDTTITVPEGDSYTWEAIPNEGFTFPPGFDPTGTISIETCSNPESLPFTGFDLETMAVLATVLLGTGSFLVATQGRREES